MKIEKITKSNINIIDILHIFFYFNWKKKKKKK